MQPEEATESEAPLTDADEAPKTRGGRRKRVIVLVALAVVGVAVVAAASLAQLANDSPLVIEGKGPAKPFTLENVVKGEPDISLARYRGQPVVVNFWASWCVPCRREMPGFQAVHQQLGDRVAFIGVNHQDDRAGALDLMAETGVRYPSGYDPKGAVAADYGFVGLPTTLFISAEGRLLERRSGEIGRADLTRTIERLFPNAVGAPRRRAATMAALCAARDQAAADPAAARRTFFDGAHDELHAIAGEVEVVDRAAAARLLVAKQAVEAGFAAPSGPELSARLDQLARATQTALTVLGTSPPPC